MSDGDRRRIDNVSLKYFDDAHQILDRRGRPLANVYWARVPRPLESVGTAYMIHGYGGSPIEPCMKLPMQTALKNGFDVVAVEGAALSATSGADHKISDMNLARQKLAMLRGLTFARELTDLNQSYKIAWPHSISCRALADLMVLVPEVRAYFDEIVLNNPYFMPPSRVQRTQEKYLSRDPSGKMWRTLLTRASKQMRQIENVQYSVPTCLYNLSIPLPAQWRATATSMENLAYAMSSYLGAVRLYFVLGSADDMAEYDLNVRLYDGVHATNKELMVIPGANHSFENALESYGTCKQKIFADIRSRRLMQY